MGQKRFPLSSSSAEGAQPVRICIVEADNLLVGFTVPSILGVNDIQWSSVNLFGELLRAQLGLPRLFASHMVERRGCGIPMQGPIYAAALARQHGHQADVYFPRLSPSARSLEMLRQTIRRYDVVFVSALTNTTWAQKHIINLVKEEQTVAVATGASSRMYRCRQMLGIQLSVRAINFLDEFDPYLLPRARRLGLEFVWIGFEDLLGEDNRSAVGRVKSTRKENLRAITALKRSGIIIGSQLLCTMRGYRLGYAQEVALEARRLGVDMIQLFAEASFEGTESACRNEEAGILLHQVAPVLFGNEWRDLGMSFYRGETVSATPLEASSLGMQLDIVKAILSFGRLRNHLKMFREWRKKGWRTTLNTMIASAALYAGVARDLLHWLKTVEIRDGKSYLRILAESDPRWRSEPETIQWVQELDLQRIVGHN